MTSFGTISHVSAPKHSFRGDSQMILHGFASRTPKNIFPMKQRDIKLKNGPGSLKYKKMSKQVLVRVMLG